MCFLSLIYFTYPSTKESVDDVDGDEDGCSERWSNMREAVTSRALQMHDETGIFLSLCRHGFVLVVADMIRSGEL
jgi:hypothetical protein